MGKSTEWKRQVPFQRSRAEARAALASFRPLDLCPAVAFSLLEPKSLQRKEVIQSWKDPWESSQPSKQGAQSQVFNPSFGIPLRRRMLRAAGACAGWKAIRSFVSVPKDGLRSTALGIQP